MTPPLALGAAPPDAVALPPEAVIEPLPELPPLAGVAAEPPVELPVEPPVSGSWLAEPLLPQPAATTEEALDKASRKTRREFMLM